MQIVAKEKGGILSVDGLSLALVTNNCKEHLYNIVCISFNCQLILQTKSTENNLKKDQPMAFISTEKNPAIDDYPRTIAPKFGCKNVDFL